MKLGLIINPIAGMGGKVGLKGTDGTQILERAKKLGATEEAPLKAKAALRILAPLKHSIELYTYPGKMGEDEAKELSFNPIVLGTAKELTGPMDTENAAKEMLERGIELLIFAGGDGTARNIYNVVGDKVPVIGIPAGVKIHSGVYANHPKSAGEIALRYLEGDLDTKDAEVMDIDEEAFRDGVVTAKLYGYMKIPYIPELVQNQKSGGIATEEDVLKGIAEKIIEIMDNEPETLFIVGSGTTLRPIMEGLELPNTLLGIDIVKNRELIASDANERQILDIINGHKAKIIVTVIGGQGYIFGRGNQQLSGEVVKRVGKENIIIAATKDKLQSLDDRPLLVDTGDEEVNAMFSGYTKVIINYSTVAVHPIKGL
ncbi:ATP-NAD kinase family protein [Tissierella sp. Yu-01]|uniref:ATP-NAD kinase family protein n=1 Tax=Tissierella sp. Yu-01 TaxID=3035694 RepID=UPI00240D0C46|nr:ATP-NAD kinase family protein [Tissierella sp. Yu-01]WFA08711.1 ATP-NAD kinase family protein [Tissierella sp. Yu-01]